MASVVKELMPKMSIRRVWSTIVLAIIVLELIRRLFPSDYATIQTMGKAVLMRFWSEPLENLYVIAMKAAAIMAAPITIRLVSRLLLWFIRSQLGLSSPVTKRDFVDSLASDAASAYWVLLCLGRLLNLQVYWFGQPGFTSLFVLGLWVGPVALLALLTRVIV